MHTIAGASSAQLDTIERLDPSGREQETGRGLSDSAPVVSGDRSEDGGASSDAPSEGSAPASCTGAPETILLTLTRSLAAARTMKAGVDLIVAQRKEAFALDNAKVLAEQKTQAAAVEALEVQLRALALDEYRRTQVRAPCAGVEIKMGTEYQFAADDALAWAKVTKLAILPESLDVAAFKKIAAATPLPFVTKIEVPKVYLATNLEKALAAGVTA